MRRIIISLIFIFLSGCASDMMKSHVGNTIADAIDDLGVPATSYDMPDGTRAFVWQETKMYVGGGQSYGGGYTSPVYSTTNTCAYTMYAKKVRELDSLTSWEIVGYKKPKLDCE